MSESTTYTDSAKVDHIKRYIDRHREILETVYSLKAFPNLKIQFDVLKDETMTSWFAEDPEKCIGLIKAAMYLILEEYGTTTIADIKNQIQLIITPKIKLKLHEVSASYEGTAFETDAQIVMMGHQETYVKEGQAKCPKCQREARVARLGEPPTCYGEDCERFEKPMTVDQATLRMGDIQRITIQEPLDEAKHGSPKSFQAVIRDHLVLEAFMGQTKKLVAVPKSLPQKGRSTHSILLNILSAQDVDTTEPLQPTTDQIKFFKKIADEPTYHDFIMQSIAPQIKFEDLAKFTCMLAVIGGRRTDGIRHRIHNLLVGNPAMAKSAILNYYTDLPFQKAAIATGGTASGSGITASLVTMPDRTKRPRAGIVSLCSGGFVALDELNQFEPEDVGKLYDAMEIGRFPFRKGGYDQILEANTTILAGVNPRWHIYDFDRSIKENVNLPAPLLSRFDLKSNMVEIYDLKRYKAIQYHIDLINDIGATEYVKRNNLLTPEQISLFINYVKTFNPEMTEEAKVLITDFFIDQKELEFSEDQERKGAFRIDNRFSTSIRRIASALAAFHQSHQVTKEHALTAVELYKDTMRSFKLNPDKGLCQYDMEEAQHTPKTAFETVCRELEAKNEDKHFSEAEISQELLHRFKNHFKNDIAIHETWKEFEDKGRFTYKAGRYKLV